ncbi:phage portal protein [Lawsonibacter faecis]|uniref:Phage portal protein n=1 Tax=Lawsonibacter faecis TaxID=2763052 RepID=A0A8J6MBX8_9FIRM|nr:phage portal protein [Lawsonibacter faecis]MBC5736085.1 phage portal protein [Lawsonibacter faecis]
MLFGKAMGRPRAAMEERTLEWGDMQAWLREVFFSGEELGVNTTSAERLSPVAAAHRILTNAFGLIPFGVYKKDGDARASVSDEALDRVLKVRPNINMSPFLLGKVVMSNAFWHGVGYCWNRRDPSGAVTERIPLPTECCSVRRDSATGLYWYDFNVDGVQRTFASYELSMLFFESYDGIRGRGLLDLARETVASDGMAQRYGKKFYQNGARLSGVLEVDTNASRETRDKLKSEFRQYATDDAFAVAVLDHGMKYTPIGVSQSDAQFIESRQFGVEEISRFTGIPKYMLQVGKEAYNSNAQQRIDWVTDTLLPYVLQWEQENTYKLPTPQQRAQGWYLRGNVEVLLRADPKTRAEFYEKMVQNSVYCPDDCRAKEEKNPIPGGLGQEFLATKNLGSLRAILKGEE